MDGYVVKFSRFGIFWKKKKALGHKYDEKSNRMDVYTNPTGIFSIPNWKGKFYLELGEDWHRLQEKQMSEEAKREIKTKGEK